MQAWKSGLIGNRGSALWIRTSRRGTITQNERRVPMTELEQLTEQLKGLPRRQYVELIRKVDAERRKVAERENNHPPVSGMTKESFIQWIARHHFAIDKGITKILYLPAGAPDKEVRLLEVN